jgi:hypothetical protein
MNASKEELIDKILGVQKGKKQEDKEEQKKEEQDKPRVANLADIRARTMSKTAQENKENPAQTPENAPEDVPAEKETVTRGSMNVALEDVKVALAALMGTIPSSGGNNEVAEKLEKQVTIKFKALDKIIQSLTNDLNELDGSVAGMLKKAELMEVFLRHMFSEDKENPFSSIEEMVNALT